MSSKSRQTLVRSVITPDVATDPVALAKTIQDMVEAALRGSEDARANPFNAVYIQQNVQYTLGQQLNIRHNLGIPWLYAFPVHFYPGSFPCDMVRTPQADAPPGIDSTINCSIIPTVRPAYSLAVGNATNASPIVVTTGAQPIPFIPHAPHGLVTGDYVSIAGVLGNTNANGIWQVTVIDPVSFSISAQGNGSYTQGGVITGAGYADIQITG